MTTQTGKPARRGERKTGQMMFLELMIAALLFAAAISIYYAYGPHENGHSNIADLTREARLISDSLISRGHPVGWTLMDVERIGLTDGENRLNTTKLEQFANITYEDARFSLGASYDFVVTIEETDGTPIPIPYAENDTIGMPGMTPDFVLTMEGVTGAIQTERIVVYRGKLITLRVLVWEGTP
ncbi:MAG: hypothetical protein ABIC95_07395 [archaeon]